MMATRVRPWPCLSFCILALFLNRTISAPGPQPKPPISRIARYQDCLRGSRVDTTELVLRDTTGATVSDSSYSNLNHQWNKCCGQKAPVAYFVVTSVSDVQAGVRCARLAGVRVVPKSGGHSYGKFSFGNNETVVIDLRKLDRIKVNRADHTRTRTVTIWPGALMGQINYKLYNEGGFTFPFGACQTVGMAYGLGGGFSEISRLYGMNVDALLEVDMVDAHGHLHTVNEKKNPGLFWALRGGGGGSYGIVTRFKYKLFRAPTNVVQGRQNYAVSEYPSVYSGWRTFIQSNPPNNVNAIIRILPTQANVIELTVNQFQFGNSTDIKEVQAILARFPGTTLGPPTVRSLQFLNFVMEAGNEETGFNINITDTNQLPLLSRNDFNPSGTLYAKTFYAPRFVENAADVQRIYNMLSTRPASLIIIIRVVGGKIATVSPQMTAFVHRGQNVYEEDLLYVGPHPSEGAEARQQLTAAKRWMNEYFELTRSLIHHKESFQNHLDVDLVNYLDRYYGENKDRLIQVKDVWDPENVFHNPQSIPPSRLYQSG